MVPLSWLKKKLLFYNSFFIEKDIMYNIHTNKGKNKSIIQKKKKTMTAANNKVYYIPKLNVF